MEAKKQTVGQYLANNTFEAGELFFNSKVIPLYQVKEIIELAKEECKQEYIKQLSQSDADAIINSALPIENGISRSIAYDAVQSNSQYWIDKALKCFAETWQCLEVIHPSKYQRAFSQFKNKLISNQNDTTNSQK